ncbi:phosphoenolpyruvate carboxylase, partial [Salmonella enterica subsp. enterica serovar Virginia]|nr:phosphoenolpyruvate carboxylase [Salmonella enterica subsp. enterica serovar Virginia]
MKCFGVPLVRIDIRQESTRHTEALGEITRYLGIGDYESMEFLEGRWLSIHVRDIDLKWYTTVENEKLIVSQQADADVSFSA